MRQITLTLDDDVVERLVALQTREGRPFDAIVNELLRDGLFARSSGVGRRRANTYTQPVDLGEPLLPDVDDVSAALGRDESTER